MDDRADSDADVERGSGCGWRFRVASARAERAMHWSRSIGVTAMGVEKFKDTSEVVRVVAIDD